MMNNTVAIGARSAGALIGVPIVVAYLLTMLPMAQFGLPILFALPAIAVFSISLKKIKNRQRNKRGVAPVLATLLMIAVAVAMSVIIFMWSQGFLSGTSGAAQSQTSQQNVAAQSSISLETIAFGLSPSGLKAVVLDDFILTNGGVDTNEIDTDPDSSDQYIQLVVRNVGGIAVSIGGITINGQIHQLSVISETVPFPGVFPCTLSCNIDGTDAITGRAFAAYYGANGVQIAPSLAGDTEDISIPPKGFAIVSIVFPWDLGSVTNIKVTTTAGTFAQQVTTSPAD